MKSHELIVYYNPPNFLSYLQKQSPSLAVREIGGGSPWLQTLNCNSLQIPNKSIIAGEISGSLFVSGQQPIHIYLIWS